MKGLANNNYKLSGSLSKKECEVAKGGRQTEETLSMCGNMSKKYCQRGNKALLNCNCGTDENLDGFGLGSQLIDSTALEVTADPAARVDEEVR